jgi:hypothetical protein
MSSNSTRIRHRFRDLSGVRPTIDLMSIKSFNTLNNVRSGEMERLRERQATTPRPAAASEEATAMAERLDLLSLHRQFVDRLDAQALGCRAQSLGLGMGGAIVAGVTLLAAHHATTALGALGGACGMALAAGCALAGFGTFVSTFRARHWSAEQRAQHENESAGLRARLAEIAAKGRADGEQRVRKTAPSSVGMAVLDQTGQDPSVALARQRLESAQGAIDRRRAILEDDRSGLFAAVPERVERIWPEQAQEVASAISLALSGGALGVGVASGLLFGLEVGTMAGFVAGAAALVAGRLYARRVVPAAVERVLRRELGQEIDREQSQLEARRTALGLARDEASARYAAVAEEAPAPPAATVSVAPGHVDVGGIRLPRRTA